MFFGSGIGFVKSLFGHQAGEDYFGEIDGKTLVETAVLRQIAEEILSGDGVNDLSVIRLQ